jgi:hypothetical protein
MRRAAARLVGLLKAGLDLLADLLAGPTLTPRPVPVRVRRGR